MYQHSMKIQFSTALHRRTVSLGKNESYYGFVLGIRYNRQHYWDYKALFDYGLCLPRINNASGFIINTKGLKRLMEGDYDQATGMERRGRARWKKVKTALKMAAMMGKTADEATKHNAAPPAGQSPERSAAGKEESSSTKRRASARRLSSQTSTGSERSNGVSYRRIGSKDSLMVEESRPYIDERMLRLQRAGYAQINVMMRGNSFNVDNFDSMSLPAGKSEGIGALDRRLTRSADVWRTRTPVVSTRRQRLASVRETEIRRDTITRLTAFTNDSAEQGDHLIGKNGVRRAPRLSTDVPLNWMHEK